MPGNTSDLDVVTRLRAIRQGRAQLVTTHRQAALHAHALVLAPVAMAGENVTVHAIAYGRVGQITPTILTVPDPRRRDDQGRLLRRLAHDIDVYVRDCQQQGCYPQLIVSCYAAAQYLDLLSERLRRLRDDPDVQWMGEYLAHATHRLPVPGQQALHMATRVLAAHWVQGYDTGADEHLGVALTWIDPPSGTPLDAALASAGRGVMGIKTDVEWDRHVLAPLVAAYARAVRSGSRQPIAGAASIDAALTSIVTPVYHAIQRAVALVRECGLPPLPALGYMDEIEHDAFARFWERLNAGKYTPARENPRTAAYTLATRLVAGDNYDAALLADDRVTQARAQIEGRLVVGVVVGTDIGGTGGERILTVLSWQDTLRVRPGDRLYWAPQPRLSCILRALVRTDEGTHLTLTVTSGMRTVRCPTAGEGIMLLPAVPDWDRGRRESYKMWGRRTDVPWSRRSDDPAPHK